MPTATGPFAGNGPARQIDVLREVLLGLLADKYGFKLADVKIVPLQSLSNAAAALKGETVDAALLPISTARALVDSGGAKFLGWVGDETPWQLGAVFASPKTLTNKPLVTKLLGALARADREYHDVILAAVTGGDLRYFDQQSGARVAAGEAIKVLRADQEALRNDLLMWRIVGIPVRPADFRAAGLESRRRVYRDQTERITIIDENGRARTKITVRPRRSQ